MSDYGLLPITVIFYPAGSVFPADGSAKTYSLNDLYLMSDGSVATTDDFEPCEAPENTSRWEVVSDYDSDGRRTIDLPTSWEKSRVPMLEIQLGSAAGESQGAHSCGLACEIDTVGRDDSALNVPALVRESIKLVKDLKIRPDQVDDDIYHWIAVYNYWSETFSGLDGTDYDSGVEYLGRLDMSKPTIIKE